MSASVSFHSSIFDKRTATISVFGTSCWLEISEGGISATIFFRPEQRESFEKIAALLNEAFAAPPAAEIEPAASTEPADAFDIPF